LAGIVGDLFQKPFAISWDKIVFGVDNSDIPLYVHMNDVYEIIQGASDAEHYNYSTMDIVSTFYVIL